MIIGDLASLMEVGVGVNFAVGVVTLRESFTAQYLERFIINQPLATTIPEIKEKAIRDGAQDDFDRCKNRLEKSLKRTTRRTVRYAKGMGAISLLGLCISATAMNAPIGIWALLLVIFIITSPTLYFFSRTYYELTYMYFDLRGLRNSINRIDKKHPNIDPPQPNGS